MSLRDDILGGGFDLSPGGRDDGAIAAALSVGRVRIVSREIGKGEVLDVLGFEAGNAFLDQIDSLPDFRHAKQLLANARLDIGNPTTRAILETLTALLSPGQIVALKAIAEMPDEVTSQQVTRALEGYEP